MALKRCATRRLSAQQKLQLAKREELRPQAIDFLYNTAAGECVFCFLSRTYYLNTWHIRLLEYRAICGQGYAHAFG